jgi:hypothetical protein
MSRRDLCQPSFVDVMVRGYGKVGGFLDRIEQGFDWSAFEALLSPIHGSAMGAASLSAFDDVQDRSSAAMAHAFRSRRRGRGARPAVVPPFLWPAAGRGYARPRLDLAVSPDDRQAWPVDEALGRVDGITWKVKHARYLSISGEN